jgi:hypothetical protein
VNSRREETIIGTLNHRSAFSNSKKGVVLTRSKSASTESVIRRNMPGAEAPPDDKNTASDAKAMNGKASRYDFIMCFTGTLDTATRTIRNARQNSIARRSVKKAIETMRMIVLTILTLGSKRFSGESLAYWSIS